jgi:predicted dehydrogenase
MSERSRIRYGVVGLGHIAQVAVLPAFAQAKKNSQLTALVTHDPKKARKLSSKYRVPAVYDYEHYEDLLNADVADALYICLPNHLHTDFAVRALRKGIHVLCEKPLALSETDCRAIADAAASSGAKVMTAYRLHFEQSNLKALDLCKRGKLGELRYFSSNFSYQVKDPGNIRLRQETGGGPVWDIGVYCINAVRTLFQSEPESVFAFAARNADKRFTEVDEMLSAVLRFPGDRLASFTCSFGADTAGSYEVYGTKGGLRLENAYEYATARELYLLKDGEVTKKTRFKKADQFAPEIAYFSNCILQDKDPEPSAEEGLKDVRVVEAINRSIETGLPIHLTGGGHEGPTEDMAARYRPHGEPKVINAHSPSGA